MTHCKVCWQLHGRAAKLTPRHWFRCHVRKSGFALWLAVLLVYAAALVSKC